MKKLLTKIATFFLSLLILACVANMAYACTQQGIAAFGMLMISMVGSITFAIIIAHIQPIK